MINLSRNLIDHTQKQHYLKAGVFMLFIVAVVLRWSQNELVYFIHPRSISLIVAASLVCIGLIAGSFLRKLQDFRHVTTRESLLLLVCSLSVLLIPAQPLSSRVSQLRAGVTLSTTRDRGSLPSQTQRFTVLDWVIALANDQAALRYEGKPVDVIALLEYKDEAPRLTRLVVSCCVLDAQPVELNVVGEGIPEEAGLWIRVIGTMRYTEEKEGFVQPTSIEVLSEPPAEPYLY
jgi:uncharacterized repeat protein (TIGR03943 family)